MWNYCSRTEARATNGREREREREGDRDRERERESEREREKNNREKCERKNTRVSIFYLVLGGSSISDSLLLLLLLPYNCTGCVDTGERETSIFVSEIEGCKKKKENSKKKRAKKKSERKRARGGGAKEREHELTEELSVFLELSGEPEGEAEALPPSFLGVEGKEASFAKDKLLILLKGRTNWKRERSAVEPVTEGCMYVREGELMAAKGNTETEGLRKGCSLTGTEGVEAAREREGEGIEERGRERSGVDSSEGEV